MKLKAKLLIIVSLVFSVFAFCGHIILHMTLYPRFLELEYTEAKRDMQRCRKALENEIVHLTNFAGDWAYWDDSYQFVLDGNQAFIDSNLDSIAFSQANLNLIYFLNDQGKVIWGKVYDNDFATVLTLPDLIRDRLPRLHPLLQNSNDPLLIHGYHKTSQGPMLVASHPITDRGRTDKVVGTLIMGRFLSDAVVEKTASQIGLHLTLFPLSSPDLPKDVTEVFKAKNPPDIHYMHTESGDKLHSYILFRDLAGGPLFLMQGKTPRNISIAGGKILHFALIFVCIAGFFMLVTVLFVLQRIVILPLQHLTVHTLRIVDEKDLEDQVPLEGRADEVGALAKEINKMLQRIRNLYGSQEKQVKKRTRELFASNKKLRHVVEEHRETQRQLQLTLDELEIIFQNTQAGILVLKGGQKVDRVNQRFCEIMGYDKPEDVIGRSVRDFHLSEVRFLDFGDRYYKPLAEGEQTDIEYPLKRKDGEAIWCLLAGKVLDSSQNSDPDNGAIWIVDDITDQKEAESRLKDLARLQGVMSTVGAVCHEIAQPIQVIDNQLQMLQKSEDLSPQLQERLEIIKKENERLTSTTRKLRKISKYETMDYVSGIKILDIEKASTDR